MIRHECFAALCVIVLIAATLLAYHSQASLAQPEYPRPPASECPTRDVALHVAGGTNIAFVCEAEIGGHSTLFILDSGFAGMPVLSLPVLAVESGERQLVDEHMSIAARAMATTLRRQDAALDALVRKKGCCAFSGGCTQTLMGIGANTTTTSDTVLAPPILLRTTEDTLVGGRFCSGRPNADVLSTTRMATPHILTLDYLRQSAPVLVAPRQGVLRLSLRPDEMRAALPGFRTVSTSMSGGSFVTKLRVGGAEITATVDTGAAVYVALGPTAAARVRSCDASDPLHVTQHGVSGEVVCSTVLRTTVDMGGLITTECPVYVNSIDLGDVDGYVGAALLEAYELLILERELRIRPVGDVDVHLLDTSHVRGVCDGYVPNCVP